MFNTVVMPGKPWIKLKVNKEGTGGTIACPLAACTETPLNGVKIRIS